MATREENLKKINYELEQIAGGQIVCMSVSDQKKDPEVKIENQSRVIHVR